MHEVPKVSLTDESKWLTEVFISGDRGGKHRRSYLTLPRRPSST